MAKGNPILTVRGLRRAFGPTTIFEGFDLDVRAGEAVVLTGRNGAGKSTLLRCLVGADKPDSGSITVEGEKMSETSKKIRQDVATVIDDLDFFPDLSVVEHLDLLARAHGLAEPDAMVDAILEEVQLVPQSGQLPGTLSSGQRRRLALATAFVRPRKLLILDEPEQRLDVEGVRWLSERLNAELKEGLAIVFASHEPYLVENVATRVVRLGPDAAPGENRAEVAYGDAPVAPATEVAIEPQSADQAQPAKPTPPAKNKPRPSHGKKRR